MHSARIACFLLCVTTFLSCSSIRQIPARTPSPAQQLRISIDRLLSDSLLAASQVGVKIVSIDSGDVLYDLNGDKLFHPASNAKLFTSALALTALGKDFEFRTRLYSDSLADSSTVAGNVYLRGSGDPDLTLDDLRKMIGQLRATGIRTIRGDLVGDIGYFDDKEWGKGWMWDDDPEDYAMHLSPLSVDKNIVRVTVIPNSKPGKPVWIRIAPPTSYFSIRNAGMTGPDTSENTLRITRSIRPEENIIEVHGSLPANSDPSRARINVWKPELYTLTLFGEELADSGITVLGNIRLDSVPARSRLLVEHARRLDSVLVDMNRTSDNLAAENLMKTVAAERRKEPGSTAGGIGELNRLLAAEGIDTLSLYLVDGSGLSEYNLVSPGALARLLTTIYGKKDTGGVFRSTLPIGGRTGTLESRMQGTVAEGNVYAKTGTISSASTLSGYAKAQNGEMLAFSIMMENYIGSSRPYRDMQDSIAVFMCRFQR